MLTVTDLSKSYVSTKNATTTILQDVSLAVEAGETVSLIGPSGCGKSTLLRCIAGTLPYETGNIDLDGDPLSRSPRSCAMVFQDPSLLPWRTTSGNVRYGLEIGGVRDRGAIGNAVEESLKTVGLDAYASYFPSQLSGGMKQRANLARALACDPRILLMDEPFGALDALTKEKMHQEMTKINQLTDKTVLFVTHDIEEALFISDKVAVMASAPGRIIDVVDVPFPRPRDRSIYRLPEFQDMRYELRSLLGD